jgi:hypothetical protein
LYVQVYIENDFKELNVCVQYSPVHKNGVMGKKLAPRDNCKCDEPPSSVRQHHTDGSLYVSSLSRISPLIMPAFEKKKFTSAHLNHRIHARTGRKNLFSPKGSKKMIVPDAD